MKKGKLKRSGKALLSAALVCSMLVTSMFPGYAEANGSFRTAAPLLFSTAAGDAVTQSVYRSVYGAAADAPVLDTLPKAVNTPTLLLKGKAEPGAEVGFWMVKDDAAKEYIGKSTVEASGLFQFTAQLKGDGVYRFTAVYVQGGSAGAESEPVQVRLITTPPEAPRNGAWTTVGTDQIVLAWEPGVSGGAPVKYRVLRNGVPLAETVDTRYTDTGIPAQSKLEYEVYALDEAGNASAYPLGFYAGTPHPSQQYLNSSTSGTPGNGDARDLALSGDGRKAAFVSAATNLVPGAGSDTGALYVRSLGDGAMESVPLPFGVSSPLEPMLNEDGSVIVFLANVADLAYEVMVREPGAGAHSIAPLDADAHSPSVSRDGETIVFETSANRLIPGDEDGSNDFFVYQRSTKSFSRIAIPDDIRSEGMHEPIVSGSGRYVAFYTGCNEGCLYNKVYVADLAAGGATELIAEGAWGHSVSDDGRYVAYGLSGSIYVWDREAAGVGKSKRVLEGTGSLKYSSPRISGDGRKLIANAYDSGAAGYGGHFTEVRWLDLLAAGAVTVLVTNPSTDGMTAGLSRDGMTVGFASVYTAQTTEEGTFRSGVFTACPSGCSNVPPTGKPIEKVTWQAPMAARQHIQLGSQLEVTVAGAKERRAEAVVTYAVGSEERIAEVALTEKTPGLYTGVFPLTTGITEIRSLLGRVADSDGSMVSKPAEGLPAPVSAAVDIQIDDLSNAEIRAALNGSRLVGWSASKKTGGQSAYNGQQPLRLALPDAPDYRLTLLSADGAVLAETVSVSAAKGELVTRGMTPQIPAYVLVKVVEADQSPKAYIPVTAGDAADPQSVATGLTNVKGEVKLRGGYIGGKASVKVQLPRPYAAVEPAEVLLEGALTPFTVPAVIHYGTVTGQVTDAQDQPVSKALVRIRQAGHVAEGTTDAHGMYRISVPEGDAIAVSYSLDSRNLRTREELAVQVKGSGEQQLNLRVYPESKVTLAVDLYTRAIGSSWKQEDLTSSLNNLYTFRLYKGDGKEASATYLSNGFVTSGVEGETFKLCVSDRYQSMGSDCQSVTIDNSYYGKAELRLQEKAVVTGKLQVDPAIPLNSFYVVFYKMNADGTVGQATASYVLNPGLFRISFPESGKYTALFGANGAVRGLRAVKSFTVFDGEVTELGSIELAENAWFSGLNGNTLEALDGPAAQGSRITMRGTYMNGLSTGTAFSPSLILRSPAGTSIIKDSIAIVNGPKLKEIVELSGSGYEVLLDEAIHGESGGTIQYQLQVDEVKSAAIPVDFAVKFKKEELGEFVEEPLAAAWIGTTLISLDAPATTARNTFTVSGRTVPGSQVTVYDGTVAVGETAASAGGYWSQTITLTDDQAQGTTHALTARAAKGQNEWLSSQAFVRYDSSAPQPLHLTMFMSGHRVEADLTDGVVRKPISIRPFDPITFSVEFQAPEKVYNVQLHLAEEEIPLTLNPMTKRWEGLKSTYQKNLGPISISYKVIPTDAQVPATEEEMLQQLPPLARQLHREVLDDGEQPLAGTAGGAGSSGRTYVNTVVITSQDAADERAEVRYYYAPVPSGYKPGAPPSHGPEVYDVKFQANPSLGTMHVSAVMPVEQAQSLLRGIHPQLGALTSESLFIEIGTDIKYEIKTPGTPSKLGLAGVIYSGYEYQQKMNRLNDFADQLDGAGCMSANAIRSYNDKLSELNERLFANLFLKYVMQLTAMNLVAIGIGFLAGAGVALSSFAINYALNSAWEDDFEALQSQFAAQQADPECKDDEDKPDRPIPPDDPNDPDDPGRREIVDPKWLYDPSGYVYEAVASNRLEGVQATVGTIDPADGQWKRWDADTYGQTNPLVTDREGKYGWDVPEGYWQVRYEKDGYEPAHSEVLQVLPPHFDVNVGMISNQPPTVAAVLPDLKEQGVRVLFDKYLQADSVLPELVTVVKPGIGGEPESEEMLPVEIVPVDPQMSPSGVKLAKQFMVKASWVPGQSYRMAIDSMVLSYAGIPMKQSFAADVAFKQPDSVMEAVYADNTLYTIPGVGALAVHWTERDDVRFDHVKVEWQEAETGAVVSIADVVKGTGFSTLSGAKSNTRYTARLMTVDLDGRASSGVAVSGATLAEIQPPGNEPPGPVTAAAVVQELGGLTVTWKDAADPDLRGVRVSLKEPQEADFGPASERYRGEQRFRYDGLTLPGTYEVKLEAVDLAGRSSEAVIVKATFDPSGEDRPPGPVTGAALTIQATDLIVTWKDPSETDLRGVRLSLKPPGETEFGAVVEKAAGEQQHRYEGLTVPGVYEVMLQAVDQKGHVSEPVTVSGVKEATGRGGKGSRGGSGGGTGEAPVPAPAPELPANEAVIQAADGRIEHSVFDGLLRLGIHDGTVPVGQDIRIRRLPQASIRLPEDYRAVSEEMTLSAASQPGGALQLTLRYAPEQLQGTDPRKLGIYRKDPAAPAGWRYVGGTIRQTGHEIAGTLEQWGSYAVLVYDPRFDDLAGHWSRSEVEVLLSRHLADGVDASRFAPDSPITRAQMTKLLLELLRQAGKLPEQRGEAPSFRDVQADQWFAPYIQEAAARGLVQGDGDTFRPEAPVTRQELAVMLHRLFGEHAPMAEAGTLAPFKDAAQLADWSREAVEHMVAESLIGGVTESELRPNDTATRAQAAVILVRLLERWGLLLAKE
ncbi:S-layer homology domain-containing protein [Paenibacillus rigui]|nr:S-layer homology domain-containing protein [Paenibacillus rigui]